MLKALKLLHSSLNFCHLWKGRERGGGQPVKKKEKVNRLRRNSSLHLLTSYALCSLITLLLQKRQRKRGSVEDHMRPSSNPSFSRNNPDAQQSVSTHFLSHNKKKNCLSFSYLHLHRSFELSFIFLHFPFHSLFRILSQKHTQPQVSLIWFVKRRKKVNQFR